MAETFVDESFSVDICKLHMKLEVVPSVVCCVGLIVGLIYCFFGLRCSKLVLFLSGFTTGSGAALVFFYREPVVSDQLGLWTRAGVGLGVALLCGLGAVLIPILGLLLSGFQLGALLSTFLLMVLSQFCSLTPDWAPLSVVMATSILTAVLAPLCQKVFLVVYTSVLGATAAVMCVYYLVGALSSPEQVLEVYGLMAQQRLCWFHWAVAGCVPGLSVIGAVMQWSVTARGQPEVKKKRTRKTKNVESRRRRPRRNRRPPPLQRYTGDVLAPSYLRILQENQSGTGSSGISTQTLTDFDTRSTAPLTCSPLFSV